MLSYFEMFAPNPPPPPVGWGGVGGVGVIYFYFSRQNFFIDFLGSS